MNPSKCFIPPGSRGLLCQSVPPRAAADLDACENTAPKKIIPVRQRLQPRSRNCFNEGSSVFGVCKEVPKMYPTKLGINYFAFKLCHKQHIDEMWRCAVDEAS